MANKIETIYKNKNILYESFNLEKAVYVITISWWEETPDNYDNYNKFKKRILHDKWLDSNSVFYPLVLITGQAEICYNTAYTRKRVKAERFYTEYQITLKLRNPDIRRFDKKYRKSIQGKVIPLQTFKVNTPIVQEQIEKWVDMMFDCDYAPVTHTKKKGAD